MKKRSYKQSCALALSNDLLGERWTMLILRELLIQPCRFKQLNEWLNGMGTNLLTSRLKDLEHAGLVEKSHPNEKRSAYHLTSLGISTEPILLAYIRWGIVNLSLPVTHAHYPHWDLLAMKALYLGHHCKEACVLQFIDDQFCAWVKVSQAGFEFGLSEHINPDLVIESNISVFKNRLVSGQLVVSLALAEFLNCFDIQSLKH